MISDFFINKCLELAISCPESYSKNRELFDILNGILAWYKKNLPKEFKLSTDKSKVELAIFLIETRKNSKTFSIELLKENISTGKFKDYINLIDSLYENDIQEEYIDNLFKMFSEKLKICQMVYDKNSFENLLFEINNDTHDSYKQTIEEWEKQITKSYNSLMQVKRLEAISDAATLDLLNDDFNPVLTRFIQSHNEEKVVKTGFEDIDGQLPSKGLEKRRLYIFGGETGVGKSTMLANIITNAVVANSKKGEMQTYLYITAENLIDESLIRFYCCLTEESSDEVTERIKTDPSFHYQMKQTIVDNLKNNNANVIFCYVEPRKTTLPEIESIIDNVSQKTSLKAVFLDYLDLIRSGTNQAELRHELGEVTLGLKQLAISYDIAMITATQLNRTGYNGGEATITSIKESMRKAEDCDFVAFLQNPKEPIIKYRSDNGVIESQVVRFTILKSRNGAVGHSTNFVIEKSRDGFKTFNFKFKPMPKINPEKLTDSFNEDDY